VNQQKRFFFIHDWSGRGAQVVNYIKKLDEAMISSIIKFLNDAA